MTTTAEAFARLARSRFRSSFHLTQKERDYAVALGEEALQRHAEEFVRSRLAPENPKNDGRQTPFRGHPVFKAMHATAFCCRGCMNKWWKVPLHTPLSEEQQRKIVHFLMAWIQRQCHQEDS